MKVSDCIKNLNFQIGPFEVQESNQIYWNNNDWPIYIKCPFNVDIQKIIQIIHDGWNIKKPQIILSLISDFNSFNQWEITETVKNQLTTGFCKAASSAKMWIITNGIDVGASRLVSTLLNNFKQWEKSISCDKDFKLYSEIETICIGIVREDKIISDPLIQSHFKKIQHLSNQNLKTQFKNKKMDKFFINELHSHFIFVNSNEENELEQLLALELMYQLSFKSSWIKKKNINENIENNKSNFFKLRKISRIPFVAILIQGDQFSSIVTNEYLIKQIPVVVFKGSGGFADLLHFAYTEIKIILLNDSDEIENVNFLNDRFSLILENKIKYIFPDLIKKDEIVFLRQNLIDCILHSSQDGIDYLTFIDVNEKEDFLTKLDEYLLNAHIKSTQIYEKDPTLLMTKNELFDKNLNLTLDWNCPNIAIEETQKILLKEPVYIDKKLFQRSLIEKNREQFVEIFMDAGFKVRQLYELSTIEWFFKQALEKEFFLIVCCEHILDLQITSAFHHKNFIPKLNKLIFQTTGYRNFFKKSDFIYQQQISYCVEFKMINFIVMWSVFTFKIELIRRIWRFDVQPINLLLMVCNMLKNMASFVNDLNLIQQLLDFRNEFGHIASQLFENCSLKANFRALKLLNLKTMHHENQMACDVAANAMVFSFIAHSTTQKWLTSIFMNGIIVKKIVNFGFLDKLIPEGLKIILCVIFVYPINFWLHFVEFNKQKYKKKKLINKTRSETSQSTDSQSLSNTNYTFNFLRRIYKEHKFLFKKWLLLMNAPITKFWISQIFFLFFLSLFTISVILPSCGNKYIDISLFIWYNLIVLEDIRKSYMISKNYISMNITYKYLEIPLVLFFLVILYLGRILDYKPISIYQYYIKMLMCLALLHNYFRFVAIYLPINVTLGPLFYYLKQMSFHDSFFFLILCLPVLIGSGIVIQVSLYPEKEFNLNSLRMIIYRIFFNIFVTLDDEFLYKKKNCLNSTLFNTNENYHLKQCKSSFYQNVDCPNVNFWSYLFLITYLILLKLVLMNILGAMFNTSLVTIDTQTIWRYQRFNLIMFFDLNSPFPPPFNLFYYVYFLNKYLIDLIRKSFFLNQLSKQESIKNVCNECSDKLHIYFWRSLCESYKIEMDKKIEIQNKINLINKNQNYFTDKIDEKQIIINELKSNLSEIKKIVFQLDYTNCDLSDKEMINKLKWIIRK